MPDIPDEFQEPEPLTPEQKRHILQHIRASRYLLKPKAAKAFEAAFYRAMGLHNLEIMMMDDHCPGNELAMTSVAALARYIEGKHLDEEAEGIVEDEESEAEYEEPRY